MDEVGRDGRGISGVVLGWVEEGLLAPSREMGWNRGTGSRGEDKRGEWR